MKSKFNDVKVYFYSKSFYQKLKSLFLSSKGFFIKKTFLFSINKKKYNYSKNKIEKGFLYTAFGENFYKECISSAKILKKTTDLPICLFTDQKKIKPREKSLFESIKYMPNLHVRSKVDYIALSPFEKTIYLDTDIIVVKSIDELFDLLENFDILATLDTARKRENISKKISEYRKIPYSFGEVNSGLICFNNHAKEKILKYWPKIFYKYMNESGGWDQPSLRILLWKYKASLYILPPEFNIRSKVLLEKVKQNKNIFGTDHMSPRIFHMHLYEKIYKNKINKILTSEEMIIEAAKRAYEINY